MTNTFRVSRFARPAHMTAVIRRLRPRIRGENRARIGNSRALVSTNRPAVNGQVPEADRGLATRGGGIIHTGREKSAGAARYDRRHMRVPVPARMLDQLPGPRLHVPITPAAQHSVSQEETWQLWTQPWARSSPRTFVPRRSSNALGLISAAVDAARCATCAVIDRWTRRTCSAK